MNWDKNNNSHYAMYKFIRNLHFAHANSKGKIATFSELGEWKNDFVLDSVGAPKEALNARARDVIFMFNRYLFDKWEVNFKAGVDLKTSIDKLSEGFVKTDSTVSSVGPILSELYEFADKR